MTIDCGARGSNNLEGAPQILIDKNREVGGGRDFAPHLKSPEILTDLDPGREAALFNANLSSVQPQAVLDFASATVGCLAFNFMLELAVGEKEEIKNSVAFLHG